MGKRARLWKHVQDIRASYWFLPTVLVLLGLLLAGVTEWIDRNPDLLPFTLPDTFLDTQADGARSTLAVIAQAVIGVTGVMFSMTLVAVSFASGNFGPRLIGNFMRDRGNQWSLGILISTFVYSVVVLRTVQDGLDGGIDQFVPQYSLIVAMALALVCVFTLIYFVHHVPETINVSRISAGLGARLERYIRDQIDSQTDDDPAPWPDGKPKYDIKSLVSGYVQTRNTETLRKLAEEHDCHIAMPVAVGDFITSQTPVFLVWTKHDLDDNVLQDIRNCYAVGTGRTENQNPTFLAEQLIEMAARALSPGVNDPYTAMDCLNRLAAALTVAANYEGGLQPVRPDRLRTPQLDFDGLFAVTFPRCSQYVRPDDITRDHALSLLHRLMETVRPQDQKTVRAQIESLAREEKNV